MGSGKKRERDSSGGSSGGKEESETQSSKKAKIEDSTSASEGMLDTSLCFRTVAITSITSGGGGRRVDQEAARDAGEDAAAGVGLLQLAAGPVRGLPSLLLPQEQCQEDHAGLLSPLRHISPMSTPTQNTLTHSKLDCLLNGMWLCIPAKFINVIKDRPSPSPPECVWDSGSSECGDSNGRYSQGLRGGGGGGCTAGQTGPRRGRTSPTKTRP